MQFSDTTNNNGIVEQIRKRLGVDAEDYPIGELTQNVNKYYRRAISKIQEVDSRWQWDDRNATDLPIETVDLVDGQPDYELDSDVREVERIEILTETGTDTYRRLQRLHEAEVQGSIEEAFGDTNSEPLYYELKGRSVYLYPTPDYDKPDGLKMWNRRGFTEFLTTDTTKEPGFDPFYHDYLIEGASYEYAKTYKRDVSEVMMRDLMDIEKDMVRFYQKRGGGSRIMASRPRAI